MKDRAGLLLLAEGAVSLVAATYAVDKGVPYLALGPLAWWQSALRWPQLTVYGWVGTSHQLVEVALLVIYSIVVFVILHYLVLRPIRGKRTN